MAETDKTKAETKVEAKPEPKVETEVEAKPEAEVEAKPATKVKDGGKYLVNTKGGRMVDMDNGETYTQVPTLVDSTKMTAWLAMQEAGAKVEIQTVG